MTPLTPISPRDVLISRISPGTPRTEHLRGLVSNIFGLRERLANERARLAADRNLSDVGLREELAKIAKGLAKNFAELSRPARIAKSDIAAKRAGFKLPEVDKSDVVAEMKRAEIRAHTRSLPLPERLKFVEGLDDAGRLAMLDAPAMLSGLPDDRYEHVKRSYLEKHREHAVSSRGHGEIGARDRWLASEGRVGSRILMNSRRTA